MAKKNPILVFTGLAVAAVAGVVAVTKDRWMPATPITTAAVETATGGQTAAPETATGATTAEPQPPAKETLAAGTATDSQATTTDAPSTTTATQVAATEQQSPAPSVAETAAEQPAATTAAEQPAAEAPVTTTAEQPAAETQVTAAAEQPAAEAPTAAEPPATTAAEQPAVEAPATTAAETQATDTAAAGESSATASGKLAPEIAVGDAPSPEAPAAEAAQGETAVASAEPSPEQAAADSGAAQATVTVPSFDTVRVEKTGEAVVAGRAAAGAEVVLKLNGAPIGTATANDDGAFVLIPDAPLPSGSGALTVEATAAGENVAVQSEQTLAVIVPEGAKQNTLVAMVSPDQPTKILQKPEAMAAADPQPVPGKDTSPSKIATLDAVDYDDRGNIVFSGRGEAGNVARLYVDNALAGDAMVGPDGTWSFVGGAPIGTGVHSLRVDGLDAKGKVANRIEVPFYREAQKNVASAPEASADGSVAETGAETAAVAAGATSEPQAAEPKRGRVVIQPGNNLWRISRVIYGTGTRYTVLFDANKDQIRNPDMIYPGQVFLTPDVVPPSLIDPQRRDPLKAEEGGAGAQ